MCSRSPSRPRRRGYPVTMDHTEERPARPAYDVAEGTAFAFAAFVLAHTECEGEIVEFKLEEDAVACWCPRCGQAGAFGPAGRSPDRYRTPQVAGRDVGAPSRVRRAGPRVEKACEPSGSDRSG